LEIVQKCLTEIAIGTIPLHGHGVDYRFIAFFDNLNHSYPFPLSGGLMPVDDSRLRVTAEHMVHDPS
jgi:hypothetical protein